MTPFGKWPRFSASAIAGAIVLALSLATILPASHAQMDTPATDEAQAFESKTYDMEPVTPYEFRGNVRDLAKLPWPPAKPPVYRPLLKGPPDTKPAPIGQPAAESINISLASMPGPIQNFAGLGFSDSCAGGQCGAGWPPDTNGDVGPNHYIEAVNDAYAIYSKTGTSLAAFTENQLWQAATTDRSNPCDNGHAYGDPVVLYDQLADRWVLTNLANNGSSPYYECIAASMTSDPVSGGWWLYAVRMDPGGAGFPPVGDLNDYPKFGIWRTNPSSNSDCLYMAANEFSCPTCFAGTAFYSFSLSDLESGATLTGGLGFINNTTDPFTMIPSNVSGAPSNQLPPAGTPNYFVSESTTAYVFEVRKFTPGPNCSGGTLSVPTNVSQNTYVAPLNGESGYGAIVPQPNTTNSLDSLGDRLMQKVQYRNIGGAESLWVVHDVGHLFAPLRPQWAQIDVTGGHDCNDSGPAANLCA